MQLVNLNTLHPTKYGKSDPSQLRSDETVIYSSDTLISTMEYSGSISTIIPQASGLSSAIKMQLQGITQGYCSLGGQWNNANFYGANARSLTGTDRICYARGINDDTMVITEYYGSRGSKFSGYYPLLLKKIRQSNKFKIDNNQSFIVNKSNIVIFVNIMNSIMDDIVHSRLVMIKVLNKYDKIKIEGNYYYYNVVIWDYSTNNRSLEKELEESLNLKKHLEMLVKYLITRDKINVDGLEIDIKAIKESKLGRQNLSIKDVLAELSGYIEGLSVETEKLVILIDGQIGYIYESLTEEMLDNVSGYCDAIKECIDILDPYISAEMLKSLSRIEEIINTVELKDLAKFNIENYEINIFREEEEKLGYDEDTTDDMQNRTSSDSIAKGEDLYYSAEKLLEELKDKLNEVCK